MLIGLSSELAALAGVLLTGVLAIAGYWAKARVDVGREFRLKHFELRRNAYAKAWDLAANMYEMGSQQLGIDEIRKTNRDLILAGAPKVVRAFNGIADTSSEKLHATGLSENQILEKQTEVAKTLFIAIRQDLYPHQRKLKTEDIRFIRPKIKRDQ